MTKVKTKTFSVTKVFVSVVSIVAGSSIVMAGLLYALPEEPRATVSLKTKEEPKELQDTNQLFPKYEEDNIPVYEKYDYAPDELIVKFKKPVFELPQNTEYVSITRALSPAFKSVVQKYEISQAKRVAIPSDTFSSLDNVAVVKLGKGEAKNALAEISQNPAVESASLNYYMEPYYQPNDPLFNHLLHLDNDGEEYPSFNNVIAYSDADIDLPEAFDISMGNEEVIIGVIDTGLDYHHDDIDQNVWVNEDEIPNNGIDDDNNGYIDDVNGYDFSDDDNNVSDYFGHGTHCSGIIAAETDNNIGIAGICPNCKIMSLKIFPQSTTSNIIEALVYAVENGAKVTNNSYGCQDCYEQDFQNAISNAYEDGSLFIAAAGNDNQPSWNFYPSSYVNAIGVAATDSRDQKASFSNYGSRVDVAAPGVDIISLKARDTEMYFETSPYSHVVNESGEFDENGDYIIASGTSMACPMVVGLAGLLLSSESLEIAELEERLLNHNDNLISDYDLGTGRINTAYAINQQTIPLNNDVAVYYNESESQPAANVAVGSNETVNFGLVNRGDALQENLTVNLYLNEQLYDSKSFSALEPSGKIYDSFSVNFDQPGKNRLLVEGIVQAGQSEKYQGNNYDMIETVVYNYPDGIEIIDSDLVFDCEAQGINPIVGPGSGDGITIGSYGNTVENAKIKNCIIRNFERGIYVNYAENTNIVGNLLDNKREGVHLVSSSANSTISNNEIIGHGDYGIYSYASDGNSITDNILDGNGKIQTLGYSSAIGLDHSRNNLIAGNQIDHNYNMGVRIYGWSGEDNIIRDNSIRGSLFSGIQLSGQASSNSVNNNQLSRNSTLGIYLSDGTHQNSVTGNTITNSYSGIVLDGGSSETTNNNIIENVIDDDIDLADLFSMGIVVWNGSKDNLFASNEISHQDLGFWDSFSSGNTVSKNVISQNKDGIHLTQSHNDIFERNKVIDNSLHGFYIESAYYSRLRKNQVCNHSEYDILFLAGILDEFSDMKCNSIGGGSFNCQYTCPGDFFCPDFSIQDECTENQPWYCNDGELHENCQKCGCSTGKTCQADGSCKKISKEPQVQPIELPN